MNQHRCALFCAAISLMPGAALSQVAAAPPAVLEQPARAGAWQHTQTTLGSQARFVDGAGQPQLTILCNRSVRQITVSIRSLPVPSLMIATSSGSRALPASHSPQTGMASATLAASDSLFDAIAFSRGRFAVSVQGLSPLVVPAWPESARAIEDCRN